MTERIIKILIILTLMAEVGLFFTGSLSAQDNYTVIVKCYPVATNGTGTISGVEGTSTANPYYKYRFEYTTQSGNINVSYKWTQTANKSSFSSYNYGWVNFNIAGIPRNASIMQEPSMYLWPIDEYNSSAFQLNFGHNSSSSVIFPTTSSFSSTSAANYPDGASDFSIFARVIKTHGLGSAMFYSSNSGSYNSCILGDGWGGLCGSLTQSRASGIESFMVAITGGYGTTTSVFKAYGANAAASRKPFLAVCYAMPWSVTQSVQTPAASVCANSQFTLTAGATIQDVTYTPVSWQWYSATASNGDYSPMGGVTNASTYATRHPSSITKVWYRFYQTINMLTNAVNSESSTYSFTTCNTASIRVSQCCTALGSNPTFSATQVGDRSVTLTWSGMSHVDHFVIRYGVDGGLGFNEITVDRNASSKTIERLTNGRSYYFQIQAIGASGYCDTQLSDKIYLAPRCN